ncbi:hypothetical protein FOL47_009659 [Perkinsus chesapeaki]|uniref:Uncharacterized protein n=1 Tax=Perkinsus chesapeaki TaxID=330153 RepID=A0A7J6MRE2_PERCH|nr:hypothetical protein FOL47_009659 [Perkinsus chesapeaki]
MGEEVIATIDCLGFCDYVTGGRCTKTKQTRVGCRCNIQPQRCRDMYYLRNGSQTSSLDICLSNAEDPNCDAFPNDAGVHPSTTVGPSTTMTTSPTTSCGGSGVPYSQRGIPSRVNEFKQVACPTNGACSIPLFVDRYTQATLIADSTHPSPEYIPQERLRVPSGPGQEAHFGYSALQGEKRAPIDHRKTFNHAQSSMVVKVFTFAPYSLSVGTYDLYLFEADETVGEYVGQLAVIDLTMCLNEGDTQTLFARLAQYSNDAASAQDHGDFVYPTTDLPPHPAPPAPPGPLPPSEADPSTAGPASPSETTTYPVPADERQKHKSNLPEEGTDDHLDESSEEEGNHLEPGAIAGLTVGLLLAAILGCTGSWLAFKLCRRREDEAKHLVGSDAAAAGGAAGSSSISFDDNCVDLESIDPLELLDVPANLRSSTGAHSVVLYPTPDSSMPSTTCTSPVGRLDYLDGDGSDVEDQLRLAAGQLLAGVSIEDRNRNTPSLNPTT